MDMNQMNVQNAPQSKGLAIAAMVIGIVSLVLSCCFPPVAIVTSVVSFIMSIVVLAKKMGGKGMAIAGLICSILGIVVCILYFAGIAALAGLGAM